MSLLTDQEIHAADPAPHERFDQERIDFARAIEAAVIARLATVSVGPHEYVWEPDGTFNIGQERCLSPKTGPCHGWNIYPVYTATAIAAARVQVYQELATEFDGLYTMGGDDVGEAIRSLLHT